jgi:hypothetical protein
MTESGSGPALRTAELPSALAALRQFARPRPDREMCELCGAGLADEHQHLLEMPGRQMRCCCDACAVLFPGNENLRFHRVPRRTVRLHDFVLDDALWSELRLPIELAFIYETGSPREAVAVYPSPAGGTQSQVEAESWQQLLAANPLLARLEPEVETLLVNRVGARREYYRAPIDVCFRLVGVIRTSWRGMSGGTKVWGEIEKFFDELRQRTTPRTGAPDA